MYNLLFYLHINAQMGLYSILNTQKAHGVPLVQKQRSGCQELLFCLDLSLGNEESGTGEHMLVPFGKADALCFNPKTKSTTVSGLFTFH